MHRDVICLNSVRWQAEDLVRNHVVDRAVLSHLAREVSGLIDILCTRLQANADEVMSEAMKLAISLKSKVCCRYIQSSVVERRTSL